jgi:uncharacterized membrane protein required for colicin V production
MNKLAKATAILTLSIVTVFFSRFANGELKVKPTQKAIPHVLIPHFQALAVWLNTHMPDSIAGYLNYK